MNLPPLPLVDNHLFIDNSFLDAWTSCPRLTQYSLLERKILANNKSSLNYGGAIHHALSHRYKTCSDYLEPNCPTEQGKLLEEWFTEKPNPIDDHRQLDLANKMIAGYNEKYFSESFKVVELKSGLAVEMPFVFKLFDTTYFDGILGEVRDITVMYSGRIDLAISEDNQYFIVDHKTTSMLGDQWFKGLSVSPQMFGYCAGLEATLGMNCSGFIINALRVPSPKKRTEMEFKGEDFQRLKVYLLDGQLAEWRKNTITLIEEMLWHYSRDFMPQKKVHCVNKFGLCQYFDVCSVPEENRPLLLNSGMFVENTWSPLTDFHKIINQIKS
jgi:hypothetical protein